MLQRLQIIDYIKDIISFGRMQISTVSGLPGFRMLIWDCVLSLVGFVSQVSGHRFLAAGLWSLVVGRWLLDTRCSIINGPRCMAQGAQFQTSTRFFLRYALCAIRFAFKSEIRNRMNPKSKIPNRINPQSVIQNPNSDAILPPPSVLKISRPYPVSSFYQNWVSRRRFH